MQRFFLCLTKYDFNHINVVKLIYTQSILEDKTSWESIYTNYTKPH